MDINSSSSPEHQPYHHVHQNGGESARRLYSAHAHAIAQCPHVICAEAGRPAAQWAEAGRPAAQWAEAGRPAAQWAGSMRQLNSEPEGLHNRNGTE